MFDEGANERTKAFQDYTKPGTRGFYSFLLFDSANANNLELSRLPEELEIVATGQNLPEQQRVEESGNLKTKAKKLAEKLSGENGLKDENDRLALEQLLVGLTQTDLLSDGEEFQMSIEAGESTRGYKMDRPEVGKIEKPSDQKSRRGRIVVSNKVFSILVDLLDRVIVAEPGIQIRMSSNPIFQRTAVRANTIISKLKPDPYKHTPKVLEAVPLHQIESTISEWSDYKQRARENL